MSMIEGVLAGMAQRTKQQTDAEDRADLKKKRQQEDEDRAFTMSERQRAIQMRQDMGNAAATVAPVEVKADKPDTMDNIDVGQPGEAPLPTAGYDVAGKRFTDRTQAATAAAEQNTPQAVTARMADVAMRNGEPLKAQQLRTGAMEEQSAKYKLNDAMRADIDAKFNADLQANVTDWDSLDKFVSDSAGDGRGGQIKVKSIVSPDGKTRVVNVVGPDGSLHPTEKVIPNTTDGLALAIGELARMPPDKKLAHLHQKAMLARQEAVDASTIRYHEGMLGVAQQNANTQEQYRKDQAEALRAKGTGASSGVEPPIWDDKADTFLRERYTSKNPETGASQVDGDGLVFAKQIALAAARDKFGGDTTSALGYAFDVDKKIAVDAGNDPAKVRAARQKILASLFAGPTTTRPATKAEAISEDAGKTGTKDFIVDINGRKQAYGNARVDGRPAPSTAAKAADQGAGQGANDRIPDPPPAKTQRGLSMVDNPAYADWLSKYSLKGWQAQKEADKAASNTAGMAARASYNPFQQRKLP